MTLLILFYGCATHLKVPKQDNVAKMYNPSSSKLHPAFMVYNEDAHTSVLDVKIYPKELLYSMANSEGVYKAGVKLNLSLYDISDPDKTELADSGSYSFSFERNSSEQRIIKEIPFKAEQGKIYQLKIQIADVIRNEEQLKYIYVDKRSAYSQQNFIITDDKTQFPYFPPYVVGGAKFRINYNHPQAYDSIYALFYGSEMPLPKPSFTLTREAAFLREPDSIWILPFNQRLAYQLSYRGLYFFQFDTSQETGLTLLNFGEDFPRIKTPAEMVPPLAYLTSSVEYNDIENATNQKLAVDNFWLGCADDMDRARELIRIYYNRVFFANYYFTSFKPGWKTDRGMIFIIYGPPQAIYVSAKQEKWLYYRKNYSSTVTFVFDNVLSPYAENNYILQRSESYDAHWRQAVESWRSGKVFLLD